MCNVSHIRLYVYVEEKQLTVNRRRCENNVG